MTEAASNIDLALQPLGAGDLIDRAVRFYRRSFWTLVAIAAPPVVVGTVIYVGWTALARQIFYIGADRYSSETFFYYFFISLGNVAIWVAETVATLVVMGGASRNFVRHLLFDEGLTLRETYRNVWKRLPGLIAASTLVAVILGAVAVAVFAVALGVISTVIGLVVAALGFFPVVAFLVSLAVFLGGSYLAIWLFFLVASRLAYVPQVMLVEGQGVASAIGRSATLAGKSVRRLAALFVFTMFAAYSALAILYIPLAWYASLRGVHLMSFETVPAWYEIAYNVIWQISFILMSPVWMIGLCLLYVDERVRREGYDIELLAARRLGDIPDVPPDYINPLQPALSSEIRAVEGKRYDLTSLGLK